MFALSYEDGKYYDDGTYYDSDGELCYDYEAYYAKYTYEGDYYKADNVAIFSEYDGDMESMGIYAGDECQLVLHGVFAAKMTWKSSDSSVASVSSNGLLKAHKAGKTTITCTMEDGTSYESYVRVY